MLNQMLLSSLLNFRLISIYLGILCCLGFVILLDIVLFFKLSLLIGPWMTVTILAVITATGVFLTYRLVESRSIRLTKSIHEGRFDEKMFNDYTIILLAGLFFIPPGIVNKLFGIVLLLPPVTRWMSNILIRVAGSNWIELYEYLRLNSIMASEIDLDPYPVSEGL